MTLPADLLSTTLVDIERLVAERTQESPHLDLKRDLPLTWDSSSKHEFLVDVTAFANTGGGDIVFGLDENNAAEASVIVPQHCSSVDKHIRRLQDIILNGAEPRGWRQLSWPVALTQ